MNRKRMHYSKEEFATVVGIAWPAVVESFFVALAGMIDTLMVSGIDSASVAAVGLTTQPKFIGLSLFIAGNVATSAIIARRRGEERREDANKTMMAILAAVIILSLVVGALCVIFAGTFMDLAGANEETHDGAAQYFRIIMGGMIFNTISLNINAAQRGSGNTKLSMRTNITSSIINICFNYLLIGGHFGFPAWGIKGAAIATVLGTVAAAVMSVESLFEKRSFINIPYIIKENISFSLKPLIPAVKLSSSVFLEQLMMRIGFVATAVMAASLGTGPMAAHQVGMNILSLSFSFGDGFQAAAVALIGQSLGRKDPKQANRYGMICQILGICVAVTISAILLIGGRSFYRLFFDEQDIIEVGLQITRLTILIVLFQIPQVIFTGSLRGAGDVLFTTISSMISVTIIRTAVSYICCYNLGWGMSGIWLGILADQACRFTLNSLRYRRGKWMNIVI